MAYVYVSASVNLSLTTDLVITNTVKFRCTSNNGNGTWFVYKGPNHDIMFQDEAIGSGYNQSKYKIEYNSTETIEIEIRRFDMNDIDVYMCSHKDKSSNQLDMREMKLYQSTFTYNIMISFHVKYCDPELLFLLYSVGRFWICVLLKHFISA